MSAALVVLAERNPAAAGHSFSAVDTRSGNAVALAARLVPL